MNKLFSPTLLKDEIVGLYDYKATIEALRQKVFGIYYLLWARRGQTSIGSQIRRSSKIVEYRSQFYSFNSLSKVNLEKTKECARSAGLEILALFMSDIRHETPIFLRETYSSTKAKIFNRSHKKLGPLTNNPLVVIAWECFNFEEDYRLSEIKKMFPIFYKEWAKVVSDFRMIMNLKNLPSSDES